MDNAEIIDRVKYALSKERKPRYHGNGFLQLYLSDVHRLHIWTEEYPIRSNHTGTIHTHRFDMRSQILVGTLEHIVFDKRACPYRMGEWVPPGPQHCLWVGEGDKTGNVVWHLEDELTLEERHRYKFAAGSEYTFRRGLFHESNPVEFDEGLVVTLITKTREYPEERPVIASPYRHVGGKPFTAEDVTDAYDGVGAPREEDAVRILEQVCERL